jgi:hypothetical protein
VMPNPQWKEKENLKNEEAQVNETTEEDEI